MVILRQGRRDAASSRRHHHNRPPGHHRSHRERRWASTGRAARPAQVSFQFTTRMCEQCATSATTCDASDTRGAETITDKGRMHRAGSHRLSRRRQAAYEERCCKMEATTCSGRDNAGGQADGGGDDKHGASEGGVGKAMPSCRRRARCERGRRR